MALKKATLDAGAAPAMGVSAALADLTAAQAETRSAAARALGAAGEGGAALLAQLPCETDPAVRECILLALARIGGEEVSRGLIPFIRSDDAGLRNACIETLQALPDGAAGAMHVMLDDPDPHLRIFACNILAELGREDAAERLCAVLRKDGHPNVCAAAVDALEELGGPEVAGALRDVRARFPEEPYLAFAVDAALARSAHG